MKKIIHDKIIYFYDDNNFEVMRIDYSKDDCVWYFNTDALIKITQDMELYSIIDKFMKQDYIISNDEILKDHKDNSKLIWYSDCYYNPDDQWSVDSVSCLNIERNGNSFNLWCSKELDKQINRSHKSYGISFSPGGNGKYSKNINTGSTLQDDFVILVYQSLLNKNKVLKKQIN